MQIAAYEGRHFGAVKKLWEKVFPDDPPWNKAEAAIPAILNERPDLFLIALEGGAVVGTIIAGYDGHRGWLYGAAVADSHRRSGIGTALVKEAESRLAAMGCVKINLQIRAANSAVATFYANLGYTAEDRISMGKRLGSHG
jgi:ribosomal protein S18 acetylase RimI-like enzyme